jgi:hypothetical protein
MNLLFFKDLLDGVDGMISDHKDRQDCHHRVNSVCGELPCVVNRKTVKRHGSILSEFGYFLK